MIGEAGVFANRRIRKLESYWLGATWYSIGLFHSRGLGRLNRSSVDEIKMLLLGVSPPIYTVALQCLAASLVGYGQTAGINGRYISSRAAEVKVQ